MKYLKIAGALAIAVAALVGAALSPADVFTSPKGKTYTGTIQASNEGGHAVFHNNLFGLTCDAALEAEVWFHGAGYPVENEVTSMSFDCTEDVDVKVSKGGRLVASALPNGNGTLKWSYFTLEALFTGFGFSCHYSVDNDTHAGTFTSSENTGGKATLDINAKLVRRSGSAFCGTYLQLTGNYVVNTPEYLSLD